MYDIRCMNGIWNILTFIECDKYNRLSLRTTSTVTSNEFFFHIHNSHRKQNENVHLLVWCRLCCRVLFSCFGGHRMEWCRAAFAMVTQLRVFFSFQLIHCFEYKWMNEERMCMPYPTLPHTQIPYVNMSITKFNYELRRKLNENELNNQRCFWLIIIQMASSE